MIQTDHKSTCRMFLYGQHQILKAKYMLLLALIVGVNFTIFFSTYKPTDILPLLPTSNETTTRLSTSTKVTCRPFTVPDSRPFFERDYPQFNLPRRLSNASYQLLLRALPSLRLIVLACGRNVESKVDNYRQHIEPILDLFHRSSRLLIFESDSSDKTVQKLQRWSRAEIYTHGHLLKKYPSRTDRLAYCRNTLLGKAHDFAPDYILVTDMDIFSTDVPSFLSNFRYDTQDWSVMTASSSGSYYDIWALRTLSDSVMNYDVWHRVWDLQKSREKYCNSPFTDLIIGIHQKGIPIEHELIEVRSAFGGAGLYQANLTHGCQYDGRGDTCEHVPFHLCMRDKNRARIFINPAFEIA